MPKRDYKLPTAPTGGGEFVWPRPNTKLRPLTELEIRELERALGRAVDRGYLVSWISRSISNLVSVPSRSRGRETRDALLQIVREGRQWLQHIDGCPGMSLVRPTTDLDELRTKIAEFCDRVDLVTRAIGASIKRGHPQTGFLLVTFLQNMIGIAKAAKVIPRTPSRAPRKPTATRPPPAFFNFVVKALEIARNVIKSSALPEEQKKAALAILRIQSNEALSKTLETLRGRTSDYHDSPHGLIERTSD